MFVHHKLSPKHLKGQSRVLIFIINHKHCIN